VGERPQSVQPGCALGECFFFSDVVTILVSLSSGCTTVRPGTWREPARTTNLKSQSPSVLRGQDPADKEPSAQAPSATDVQGRSAVEVPASPAPGTGAPSSTTEPSLSGAGATLAAAALGRPHAAPTNSQLCGLSSIDRNRLQREVGPDEQVQFNYPPVHADPARIYHERFGVEEEHDPCLFHLLMNLMFEDRWLLPRITQPGLFRINCGDG
jgi:hypothetical protein